ncbi:MAG TPA: hypothetical protein DDZ37_05710 [Spirochaetaceae bacterium]|nr:hypothetical protein [Spirochaetaceae bacterium]
MKHFRGLALAGLFAFFLVSAFSAGAQESGSDIDALFGDEVLVEPEQPSQGTSEQGAAATSAIDPLQGLLKTEAVKIGGSLTGKIGATWTWNDPWNSGFDLLNPDKHELSPALQSLVYFDARPSEDFRVHGSVKSAWPLSSTHEFLDTATTSASVTVPDIRIFELFSDFQLGDSVYFRFGKATVKWGVGYFFSPADIINLEQIDISDPTTQREGPLQFRVFIPYGQSQNTLSFYAIFDDSTTPDFSTTALAGKAEFVLGNYELGISGYYRYDTSERAALTLTGPLGNLDVFAEGVIARGSPKAFYTPFTSTSPYYHEVSSDDVRTTFYPSGTLGFLYSDQENNFTATAQYYYNGEGYSDSDRTALFNSFTSQSSLIQSAISLSIRNGDITNFPQFTGRHYAAAKLSFSEIGGSDFSASALGIMNISDLSGFVQPSLNWDIADYLKLSFSTTFGFGADNTEYGLLFQGRPVVIGLSLTAGTGNF